MTAPQAVRQWLAEQRAGAGKQPPADGAAVAGAPAGCVAVIPAEKPEADTRPLRERMPTIAAIFAELRQAWGQEQTDRLVKRMAAGHAVGYCAEVDKAGKVHEFGRVREGRRAVMAPDAGLQWVDAAGRAVDPMADALRRGALPAVGPHKVR